MGELTEQTILEVYRMQAENRARREALRGRDAPPPAETAQDRARAHTEAVFGPPHQGMAPQPLPAPRPDWDKTLWFSIGGDNVGLPLTFLMDRILAGVGPELARMALDYAMDRRPAPKETPPVDNPMRVFW